MRRTWKKWWPLIFAVFVFGGMMAVAVPNLLEARNRSSQKRTMADMRTIASAWEARATDLNTYSIDPKRPTSTADTMDQFHRLERLPPAALQKALTPKYITQFPLKDGWGNDFEFRIGGYKPESGASTYVIRSVGKDRKPDARAYVHRFRPVAGFDADIVFAEGNFFQGPEGL